MSHEIRDEVRKLVEERNRGKEEGDQVKLGDYASEKLDDIEREIEKFKELPAEEQQQKKDSFVKEMRCKAYEAMGDEIFKYDEFYSSSGFLSKCFHKVGLI